MRRVLPVVPSIVLGLLGLLSALQDMSWVGVGLGLLIALAGLGAVRDAKAGLIGLGVLVMTLTALVGYHATGLLWAKVPVCGCLAAVGDPERPLMLGLLSAALLTLTVRVTDSNARPSITSLVAVLGLALGIVVYLSAGEESPETLDIRREVPAGESPGIVLQGAAGSARDALTPAGTGADHPAPSPAGAWVVVVHSDRPMPSPLATAVQSGTALGVPVRGQPTNEGRIEFHGETVVAPTHLLVTANDSPAQLAPIEWQPRSPGTAELRGNAALTLVDGGFSISGTALDGMGRGVPDLPLCVIQGDDASQMASLQHQVERVARPGLGFAVTTTDAMGRFRVRGWRSERARVYPLKLGWHCLGDDAPGGALSNGVFSLSQSSSELAGELRVGRGVLCVVDIVSPYEQYPGPIPVELQTLASFHPRVRAGIYSELLGPPVFAAGSSRILARRLLLDAQAPTDDLGPAVEAVVSAPGYQRSRFTAAWTLEEAQVVTQIRLQPSAESPPVLPTVALDPPLPDWLVGGQLPLSLAREDSEDPPVEAVFAVIDGGRRAALEWAIPGGRYRVDSPLLKGTSTVEFSDAAVPSLAMRETAALRVKVVPGTPLGRDAFGVVLAKRGRAPRKLTVAADSVVMLRVALVAALGDGSGFLLVADPGAAIEVSIAAGGPGLSTAVRDVSLRVGSAQTETLEISPE